MMRRIIFIPIALCLLVFACEPPAEKGSEGNPLLKFYGDAYNDQGFSIAATGDGYLLCGQLTILQRSETGGGTTIDASDEQLGLVKAGLDGNQVWSANAGGSNQDIGKKVLKIQDGSFICVGTIKKDSGDDDVLVAKFSATGSLLWESAIGGQGNQVGNDIIESNNGGFVVVGFTDVDNAAYQNFNGHTDMFFLELSAQGDSLNSGSYGYSGDETAVKVVKDWDDSFVILGSTDKSDPGQDLRNIFIVRINDSFGIDGEETFGDTDDEVATDLELLSDGYIVSGTVLISEESQNGFLMKLGSYTLADQVPVFIKKVSGSDPVVFNSITLLSEGGFLVSGSTGLTGEADMMFRFFNPDGEEFIEPYISGGNGYQAAYDAIIGSDGKVVAVGNNHVLNNSLIALLKFDPWGE